MTHTYVAFTDLIYDKIILYHKADVFNKILEPHLNAKVSPDWTKLVFGKFKRCKYTHVCIN